MRDDIVDEKRDESARVGTVFRGRFHDPNALRETFSAAGFERVEILDREGPTLLHAVT